MAIDWTELLTRQLSWHWEGHLRPGLDGLSDEEYLWEPVEGCWSVRPRAEARSSHAAGAGDWVADFAFPEPEPAPVTTIAWRLAHINVGIFAMRNASHFGGPPVDYQSYEYPGEAKTALEHLDEGYARWSAGAAALDAEGLARPVGAAEGPFAEYPYAELIAHINREVIHHGAEILLLRDLYRNRSGG